MFCEERSDSLSLSFGFVERSDRLLLWSEATVYYYFCGFVLFLLWFCGAKRSIHRSLGFVERSDVLFLLCFCGAKRPLYIFPRFCGVKRPVVFVLILVWFYYHKERSCGFKVFICI